MRKFGLGFGLSIPTDAEPVLVWSDASVIDGWGDVNTTRSNAGENDPEAAVLAVNMFETVTDAAHYINANIPHTQNVNYRLRVVVKGNGRTALSMIVVDTVNRLWYATIGVESPALLSSGGTTHTVEDLGDGWYAHNMYYTITSATGSRNVRLGALIIPLDSTYVGDVTNGLVFGSIKLFVV